MKKMTMESWMKQGRKLPIAAISATAGIQRFLNSWIPARAGLREHDGAAGNYVFNVLLRQKTN